MLALVSTLCFNQSLTFLKSHPSSHSSLTIFLVLGLTIRLCCKIKASSANEYAMSRPSIPWNTYSRSLTMSYSFTISDCLEPSGPRAWLWVLLNPLNFICLRYSSCFCFVDLIKGLPDYEISFLSASRICFICCSFCNFKSRLASDTPPNSAYWFDYTIELIRALVMLSWLKPCCFWASFYPYPATSRRNLITSFFLPIILFLWNLAFRFSNRSVCSFSMN